MLRPAVLPNKNDEHSIYEFIYAVAKRAREIADYTDEHPELDIEKPVDVAVEDFLSGMVRISDVKTIDEK